MARPVILDFDRSVRGIAAALRLDLASWQQDIRFGCSMRKLQALGVTLARLLPARYPVVFLGSGDFHHVSQLLIELACEVQPVEVVVFDNHPDNMRFPFGTHCGSWVRRVTQLPKVRHVHVVGITSMDVSAARQWENYKIPLWKGRLTYWCIGVDFTWAHRLPCCAAFRTFPDPRSLLQAFAEYQARAISRIYLSIDKDVLNPSVVRTNWDQGVFDEHDLHMGIQILGERIVACDVTGEVSRHRYTHAWKRWLTARDAQPDISADTVSTLQARHAEFNQRLLTALAGCVPGLEPTAQLKMPTTCSN
jgi:hypothetical protein